MKQNTDEDENSGSQAMNGNVVNQGRLESLAVQWAKKYLQNLGKDNPENTGAYTQNLQDIVSQTGREQTAQKMMKELHSSSLQAWNQVEALLSPEISRHQLDTTDIDPWQISRDAYWIYEKTLEVYTQQAPLRQLTNIIQLAKVGEPIHQKVMDIYTEQVVPNQLATKIGVNVGALRRKYTKHDPRNIGFVSMQFHYTSKILLQKLSPLERFILSAYFQVIDDHLYMPLQRVYEAAAKYDFNSNSLTVVQKLLPHSTRIAKNICQRIIELYPHYRSRNGLLSSAEVQVSSIRDVEMFQVYLWLSILEQNLSAIQQELFPICMMLYPSLNVQWELIRQMLHLLVKEIHHYLTPQQMEMVMPYYIFLWNLFSPNIFENEKINLNPNIPKSDNINFIKYSSI